MPSRRRLLAGAAASLSMAGLAGCQGEQSTPTPTPDPNAGSPTPDFGTPSLASPAFDSGATIPPRFTCSGEEVSPPLTVNEVPTGAETLALTMTDPDANGYVHWLVWNVPADLSAWPEGVDPGDTAEELGGAAQGASSRGTNGYVGPCPPTGDGAHTYRFVLYAVDATLDLNPGANRSQLESVLNDHRYGVSILEGEFDR
jgi:Raf kinase inhibitor-like YbhB/YbcL family protein